MAHEHLNIKAEEHEHMQGKQMRVSLALMGTLIGGVLLINSHIGKLDILFGPDSFNAKILAMIGALLLGGPVVWHAFKCLLQGHSHMDELAALGIVAAFAMGEDEALSYLEATEARLGLPAVDPFRQGAARLVDALAAV